MQEADCQRFCAASANVSALPAFGCSGSFGSQNSLVAVTSVISVAVNNSH